MKWDMDYIPPAVVRMSNTGGIYAVTAYHLLHQQWWFHEPSHICGHCNMSFGEDTYCMLLKETSSLLTEGIMTAVKCDLCEGTSTFDHTELEEIHPW